MNTNVGKRSHALGVVREQLSAAAAARKCHGCGCLQRTVEALAGTEAGRGELAPVLAETRRAFLPKEYDCLGCSVCFPAIAANAFTEAFPGMGDGLDLCPSEPPGERRGWPPLPGDYHVVRFQAPVAVCALNSHELAARLADQAPEGLAIVGTLHTENLGVERIVRNVLANPHIRFLLLCGKDAEQAVGHLPGQSLASLFLHGLDERGRIIGARGKRPVLKNVRKEQVAAFVRQVELVPLTGEERDAAILDRLRACARHNPGAFKGAPGVDAVETLRAAEPRQLVPDPAGFFVVYPDGVRQLLVVEHYTNHCVLDCVIEATMPAAVYTAAIERNLLTRLDHAAYLGRELALAERTIGTGERYVQDRAPGEVAEEAAMKLGTCGCATARGPGGNR